MNQADSLVEGLPLRQRLALSYAPANVREAALALMALDARFAAIVRQAREPMLAQIKLAWWRDVLADPAAHADRGDPLLRALAAWQGRHAPLIALADAWELLVAAPPLDGAQLLRFAEGRGGAFAALGGSDLPEARRMGTDWALADLARHLSHADERAAVLALISGRDWRSVRLPAALRSLAVLHGLAHRTLRDGGKADRISPMDMLVAMRLGLFGR